MPFVLFKASEEMVTQLHRLLLSGLVLSRSTLNPRLQLCRSRRHVLGGGAGVWMIGSGAQWQVTCPVPVLPALFYALMLPSSGHRTVPEALHSGDKKLPSWIPFGTLCVHRFWDCLGAGPELMGWWVPGFWRSRDTQDAVLGVSTSSLSCRLLLPAPGPWTGC